ncbi:MAG TPA: sigma-54 dependent transcriptional regulator [Bryobacteraceae bacterium]|nr:sigma-54 dependent transcriptional regulator [Bryobacteraceae bacterium]
MSGTSPAAVTILAIDDEPDSLELVQEALAQPGVEILVTTDPEHGWSLVRENRPEIVLLDLAMPRLSGMELLDRIIDFDPSTDVVLLTGNYSTDCAVEAIRKGACDYLTKPVTIAALRTRLAALLEGARRRHRAAELEGELAEACRFQNIVGRSPLMLEVFDVIRRVGPHFRTALITGPTGTGKELVAQALHKMSSGAGHQLAVFNCSAVVETLFESELFGHVRGAFTGAVQDHIGVFEFANGGTILLDEIGDMPLTTQSKLLRVVQTQEIQRVGSPSVRKIDVRVIAATNRDLPAMIAEKMFREDLYYRLSMVELKLPSLADRREDLPLLCRHFLARFNAQYGKQIRGITRRAQAVLSRYSWPGNVRQLENVLASASMMVQGDFIDVRDLPGQLREATSTPGPDDAGAVLSLAEAERRHTLRVLESLGGNKVRTAEALGISRATLYRILGEAESEAV